MIIQVLFTVWLITLAVFIWVGINDYKIIHKRYLNPLNEFPYEWLKIHRDTGKFNFYRGLVIVILISFFGLMIELFQASLGSLFLFFVVILTFQVASTFFVFFFDPKRIEIFIYLNVVFLMTPLVLFMWISYGHYVSIFTVFPQWYGVVTLALSVIQTLIVFNPRLKQWSQLEKTGSNEKPLYRRPARFVLAYSQWLTLLNVIVLTLVSYIASLT